jgi:FAD/FMN-containing dehydrogenase
MSTVSGIVAGAPAGDALIAALTGLLGSDAVQTDPVERAFLGQDIFRALEIPLAVVRPATIEQLAAIVGLAAQHRAPLTRVEVGVKARITFRLMQRPTHVAAACVGFPGFESMAAAIGDVAGRLLVSGILGRWLPLHGVFSFADVPAFHVAYEQWCAAHAAALREHDIRISRMFMPMGSTGTVYEPTFYWPDSRTVVQERFAPPEHLQLGKWYPYLSVQHPGARELLLALKAQLDPHGILNPGALEFPRES